MKCLVLGHFNKSNAGDQFFLEAYKELFPEYIFTFKDKITKSIFNENDCLFLGGGSFLDGPPELEDGLLELIPNKPLIYLGVGAETAIHKNHQFLLEKASLIYIRSKLHLDKINKINKNSYHCPDLVYSLINKVKINKLKKSILFIPNAHLISKWNDASWKQVHWESFKNEMAQTFEQLISLGYNIDVLSMCENTRHKDSFVAIEIYNKMNNGKLNILPFKEYSFQELSEIISGYKLTISQRFHGLIVSDMVNVRCINIHHHDKLKEFKSSLTKNIDYYGVNKSSILKNINDLQEVLPDDSLSINQDIFKDLKEKVNSVLKG